MAKLIGKTFLHSTMVRNTGMGDDAVVVSEMLEYDDGTTKPFLRTYASPRRPFWYTKPEFRNHKYKKEFEKKERLDEFIVHNSALDREIFRVVNGFIPNRPLTYAQRLKLYADPYLYGANIDVQALIADKYRRDLEKAGRIPSTFTVGMLDIETDMEIETRGQINLISVTHENKCYTAIREDRMVTEIDGKMQRFTVEDIERLANTELDASMMDLCDRVKGLKKYKKLLPFEKHYYVGKSAMDLVRWIFARIHENKTSFIGIWNLDFDLPKILETCQSAGVDPEDVFCDPGLEKRFRHFKYVPDDRKVQHITNKWHVVHCTAHSRFIDVMCLYSYIRTGDGKDVSYALDAILQKHKMIGKLHWDLPRLRGVDSKEQWHTIMQKYYFLYYAVYNQGDVCPTQMLLWITQDLQQMTMLSEITPVAKFPKQTVRATNTLFSEWKDRGYILSTVLENKEEDGDEDLESKGGAVVSPKQFIGYGMKLFLEWPTHGTRCFAFGNDLDLEAQYPSMVQAGNISRGTQVAAVVGIIAPWVQKLYTTETATEVFFSYMASPHANAVEIGTEFFDLPDYEEVERLFIEEFNPEIKEAA